MDRGAGGCLGGQQDWALHCPGTGQGLPWHQDMSRKTRKGNNAGSYSSEKSIGAFIKLRQRF